MAKATAQDALELNKNEDPKTKTLVAVKQKIQKQFGEGAIIRLGEKPDFVNVNVIPSGSILLDEALGVGGYPRGRIVEMYGPESSGKTTIALHAIAEAQKLGGVAAFIDVEHALDATYAKNLGVDIDNLWVSQPEAGEQALEITEALVRSGAIDIVVLDSVAALTPRAEIEGEMGDSHMGLQARLMSQAMRKITAAVSKSGCVVVFINQIRMKIGVMFGNPETTTGGTALKFYASIRLEIRRIETIDGKGDEDAIGNRVRVKVTKNKVAPPFRKVELDIYFGKGVSRSASLLDSAVKHGIIDKRGAWYYYEEKQLSCGKENAVKVLEDDKEVYSKIEAKVREVVFPGQSIKPQEKDTETAKNTADTVAKQAIKTAKEKKAAMEKEALSQAKKEDDTAKALSDVLSTPPVEESEALF